MNGWLASLVVMMAVAAWAGFGGLVFQLQEERAAYAEAAARARDDEVRGESAARLRASVEGTVEERAALERLVDVPLLQAVEVIEQAGAAAGIDATIGAATPATAPEGLTSYVFMVSGASDFARVMKAVALFETLPIPAELEEFQVRKNERGNTWELTARIRVFLGE